jgi:hypothetical protein
MAFESDEDDETDDDEPYEYSAVERGAEDAPTPPAAPAVVAPSTTNTPSVVCPIEQLRAPESKKGHPVLLPWRLAIEEPDISGCGESKFWRRPREVEWTDLQSSVVIDIFLPVLFKDHFRLEIRGQDFDFM